MDFNALLFSSQVKKGSYVNARNQGSLLTYCARENGLLRDKKIYRMIDINIYSLDFVHLTLAGTSLNHTKSCNLGRTHIIVYLGRRVALSIFVVQNNSFLEY